MELMIIGQMTVSGAAMGFVYALVAYGFQMTYATSKSINFGQGELVMVSTFLSLTATDLGLPYFVVAMIALVVDRGRYPQLRAANREAGPLLPVPQRLCASRDNCRGTWWTRRGMVSTIP